MDVIDVDYIEVPDDPITETWYTCPNCGCLTPTGDVCACGYHPPAANTPTQVPFKRCRSFAVAIVLAIVLVGSLFYNIEQSNTNAQLSDDLSRAQSQITAKQNTINNFQKTIFSLREYNEYLQEDVEYMCGIPSDFDASKFRHTVRHQNPFLQ